MFLGTYQPIIIGKNRIALPVKLRKEINGNRLVLAMGFDDCVLGFDEKKWQEVTASDLNRPLSDFEGRRLRRKMFASAQVIELGVQGRFVIPDEMANYAEIKEEVVLIGAGDHFEIWDKNKWDIYLQKINQKRGQT